MSGKQQGDNSIVSYKNFEIGRFSHTDLNPDDKKKDNPSQWMVFPKYGEESLYLKTPPIFFEQGGVAQLGEYIKDENKRDFFKIANDPNQPEVGMLFNVFEQIDTYMQKKETRAKLFAHQTLSKIDKKNPFKYQPIVRKPDADKDGDDQKNGEQTQRFSMAKIKFDIDFETKKLMTHVYVRDETGAPVERPDITTVKELAGEFRWKSKCRFLITAYKIWIQKNPTEGFRKYGVAFKCKQMEVMEKPKGGKMEVRKYAFDGDDDGTDSNIINADAVTGTDDNGDAELQPTSVEPEVQEPEVQEPEVQEPEPEPEPVKPVKKPVTASVKKPTAVVKPKK